MKVTIVGTGHVGLVTGAVFALVGHTVTCLDKDPERIVALNAGRVPFYEPGLDEKVAEGIRSNRLRFTNSLRPAVRQAEVVMICVGTPENPDGSADVEQVLAAARQLAPHLSGYVLVAVKSTVPVGTTERVAHELKLAKPEAAYDVIFNPEFLREGSAVDDALNPDRIVVGTSGDRPLRRVNALYRMFRAPLIVTDVRTAELIKYASNSFLATRISFINELADLCEALGADIQGVAAGMGADSRIGSAYLAPGIGFGGSCLPKDTSALLAMARQAGIATPLLSAVREVNNSRPHKVVATLRGILGTLADRTVAVWGLSYKEGTDDGRESPALRVVSLLSDAGVWVRAWDPAALDAVSKIPGVVCARDAIDAVRGAEALLILTPWPEFVTLDWMMVRAAMRQPIILDGRNLLDPRLLSELGFVYRGVGRGASPHLAVKWGGAL